MNKIVACLAIAGCLMCPTNTYAGFAPKKPAVKKSLTIKPGDVLAVEVMLNGKVQIILVRVRTDGTMYYIVNGQEIPFPAVDLDNFLWEFYIKN